MGVKIGQPVDHHLWFLGGCGVVEPDQRLPVDGFLEDRKVRPHGVDLEHLVFVTQSRHRIRRGEEVVVGLVTRKCGRWRAGPAEVANRRRLTRPGRCRAARGHRNGRRRAGQHARDGRHDALAGYRERAQFGDTRWQVRIGHGRTRIAGRGSRRRIGHAAARGQRHRLRHAFRLRGRRRRDINVGETDEGHRGHERIRRADRRLSGRRHRCRVGHVAPRGDGRRLWRTVGARSDTRRIQLACQCSQLYCADRQVAFGVYRPILTCTHGTGPQRRRRARPARRR